MEHFRFMHSVNEKPVDKLKPLHLSLCPAEPAFSRSMCGLVKGLRIAAVRHLKNAGGLGPRVRGRKWYHAVHCCPVLFVWQPHCSSEGLPTGWKLMGLALHCLFPAAHTGLYTASALNVWSGQVQGSLNGIQGSLARFKTIS